MNTLKKSFAIILCLLLSITCFAGCHQKGEIAVTIGDVEFTSGYYACALVFADLEARNLVEQQLAEKENPPEEYNYWDYKVEDTEYVEWVENKALEHLKDIAAFKTLCKDASVTLDQETISLSDTKVDYSWNEYQHDDFMQENGISKETYKQYMRDSNLSAAYFMHLYGPGGKKEIAADKVTAELVENYVLVNTINVDFAGFEQEEKENRTIVFNNYAAAIKSGQRTFEDVYLEHNNISTEDHHHDEVTDGSAPQDPHATIFGSADTSFSSEHFDKAKEMAIGDVEVVTLPDDAGLVLIAKKDITADPYYLSEYDIILRQGIVGDQYQKDIEDYIKDLKCTINTSSTKQFNVKKIFYPEMTSAVY